MRVLGEVSVGSGGIGLERVVFGLIIGRGGMGWRMRMEGE